MPQQVYLNLLILLIQVIGAFSEESNKKPSDTQIRKKRIIDNTPGGDQGVEIENVPYIVQIAEHKEGTHCAGSILSPEIVITSAHCVEEKLSAYTIFAGSSYVRMGTRHIIRRKINDPTYTKLRYWDDLALLVIDPPININSTTTRKIELYEGPIPVNEQGTVSGWGCNRIASQGRGRPNQLRSITVPIISLDQCRDIYAGRFIVTTKNICTFDITRNKRCDIGDSGAPLVVRGKLIGVHGWNAKASNRINADVYMNMVNHEYKTWIMSTIASQSQIHQNHINQHSSPKNNHNRCCVIG